MPLPASLDHHMFGDVESVELGPGTAEIDMAGVRLHPFDGDESPAPLAVLRLNNQVSDRVVDWIDHDLAHMAA
jgi:hypothetical protein